MNVHMFYIIIQEEFIGKEIARIREICGPKGRVIGAVSGGVDSTVAAKLMHEAIGDRYGRFQKQKQ
jgi:GMP synthase (glutamine-hydrolysing)